MEQDFLSSVANQILWSAYLHSFIRSNLMYHFVFLSLLPLRATQVRPVVAGEEAAVAALPVETEPGMKTMRSLPSLHLTTLSPLFFTWWSTTLRATSATRCHTMDSSTRTPTQSCPHSWCLTCWHRTATSFPAKCPRWVAFADSTVPWVLQEPRKLSNGHVCLGQLFFFF